MTGQFLLKFTGYQTFLPGGTTRDFDVSNKSIEYPFSLYYSGERETLQTTFQAQDQVVRRDNQQIAVQRLIELVSYSVMHPVAGAGRLVNDYTLG